jgi:cation transport ATPase
MKITISIVAALLLTPLARAEYRTVNMTVFGMDCAPCAHAVHVSVKGIQGVDTVTVDLNTGLVQIQLAPENHADMRQIEQAIEKNGFTHKDAKVVVRGTVTGAANAFVLQVAGTGDHYALQAAAAPADLAALSGKIVEVQGTLPQAAKGRIPDTLRYSSVIAAPPAAGGQ